MLTVMQLINKKLGKAKNFPTYQLTKDFPIDMLVSCNPLIAMVLLTYQLANAVFKIGKLKAFIDGLTSLPTPLYIYIYTGKQVPVVCMYIKIFMETLRQKIWRQRIFLKEPKMKSANQNPNPAIILLNVSNPSDDQYREIIRHCAHAPCLICGGVPDAVGVFSPSDSTQYGTGPGRAKQFFYPICQDCMETEGFEDRIEAVFESQVAVQN